MMKKNTSPKKHRIYKLFNRNLMRPDICIHGHFNGKRGNGVLDFYPEIDQYITILRDPFQIHLSNYFYVKRENDKAFWAGKLNNIIADSYDIERYLSENKKSFILNFFPPDIDLNNYCQILEKKFVYIGVIEDLPGSIEHLAEKLGFSHLTVPVENVSQRTEEIPHGARDEFIKNNPLEMAIYEYAIEKYKQ